MQVCFTGLKLNCIQLYTHNMIDGHHTDSSLPLELFRYSISGYHMMSIYHIVHIQLLFVQSSILCYNFCILSKIECMST